MEWHRGVFHCPTGHYLEQNQEHLTLRLRAPLGAPIEKVYLRTSPDGEDHTVALHSVAPRMDYQCAWWEASVCPQNPRFHYRFLLMTDQGGWWFTAAGLTRAIPTDQTDFVVLLDRAQESWVQRTVFYQVFPDRFAIGWPELRVRSGQHSLDGHPVVAREWGELPNVAQGAREFFGGDLPGLTDRLPYLQERLGVNGLYLNPIFTSPSSHKYDVASYHQIDPHLGGPEAYSQLIQATTERGLRTILDIVPNHCGDQHSWFQAALADANSESAEYFTFFKHPQEYEAWLGIRSLPKLNYQSQKLREVMYEGDDAIVKRWLRPPLGLDGWRIDVANMLARQGSHHLGHKVLRGIRRAVKSVNPSAYLLGENFFDATPSLQGDQLDGAMNYRGFMMPLYHWLTGRDYAAHMGQDWGDSHALSTQDLSLQWGRFRASVPWLMTCHQLNLLGSHDTPRLRHLVGGDLELAKVARLLLFTYPGAPCVYYGDELGLDGGRDPDNRRCMNWDESTWDHSYLQGWVDLIAWRKSLPALAHGAYQTLRAEQNTIAFLRESQGQRVIVVAKRGRDSVDRIETEQAAIVEGTRFLERLSGAQARVESGTLPILSASTQLWTQVEGATFDESQG